jgi:hypothetical protein
MTETGTVVKEAVMERNTIGTAVFYTTENGSPTILGALERFTTGMGNFAMKENANFLNQTDTEKATTKTEK